MVRLITNRKFKFGQKNIVPFAGEVQISEDGIIEVESVEIAEQLIEADNSWAFVDGQSTTTTTIPVTTTTTAAPTTTTTTLDLTTTTTTVADNLEDQTQPNELGNPEGGDDLEDQIQEGDELGTTTTTIEQVRSAEWLALDVNSKAKLQEMVKAFPRSEWGQLNKDALIDYILEKTK